MKKFLSVLVLGLFMAAGSPVLLHADDAAPATSDKAEMPKKAKHKAKHKKHKAKKAKAADAAPSDAAAK